MLVANIDTYDFGVVNKNSKSPKDFLNELNEILDCEVKIYYTTLNGYEEKYQHLASKARIKNNDRFIFIAFLYVKSLDTHITVVQHSSAKYLTFKFYGLFQNDKKSRNKKAHTFDVIKKLLDNDYKLRNVKLDIAIDFEENFYSVAQKYELIFITKKREPYIYREGETIYFNTALVNECIFKQKNSKEELNCIQKNKYLNIVLYNKSLKNSLEYELTRLEFSFKNVFNSKKLKYINSFEEINILINELKKKVERYIGESLNIGICST